MKKKNMLILLVLLLTVGFASVSTTIMMNGSIGIASKKSDLNGTFNSVTVNGNNEVKATISEDKKTITFETDKLSTVGDSAELIYKVKNDSTQYDENVIVSCTGGNEEYLSIQGEFAGKSLPLTEPEFMGAQEVRMGKISVSLKKAYDANVTKVPITCTLEIEGEERDSIAELSTCDYSTGTEWTFDYTGGEQEFKVPCDGEYIIETWGAQGGNSEEIGQGGYGGFSTGTISLDKDAILYVVVGGVGNSNNLTHLGQPGGYNGGGNGGNSVEDYKSGGAGGGGATHIAKTKGLLKNLKELTSNILIVSGGGGGASIWDNGGAGGGMNGNSTPTTQRDSTAYTPGSSGATQNSGYTFGLGQNARMAEGGYYGSRGSGGGGGGFYGGYANQKTGDSSDSSGGGGSGYIGNPLLTNKVMYCYNCTTSNDVSTKTISTTNVSANPISNYAKQGNGYAKITYIRAGFTVTFNANGGNVSQTTKSVKYKSTYGDLPIPTREGYEFLGWYTDLKYTVEITSNSEVTIKTNQTLYAKWKLIEVGTEWIFDYTGGEQEFRVPSSGTYKLETWGAQGGAAYNSNYYGGYGGYAIGNIYLNIGETLYINVGGSGKSCSYSIGNDKGGYNGGGSTNCVSDGWHYTGSGGGATHVATTLGLLSTLENNRESILIVAGGGGGGYYHRSGYNGIGGHGGGYIGGQGTANKTLGSLGGTQTQGGTGATNGLFGKGGSTANGGGGGYYGGGGSAGIVADYNLAGAGGGSGYIGNSLLTNKTMYCYNCATSNEESTKTISTTNVSANPISNYAKQGDGYAKITLISVN